MNPAKIRLSQTEMGMVNDAGLILTKNAILKKVSRFLGDQQLLQQQYLAQQAAGFPAEITGSTPKISRGENYQGLPYLILDYPRVFETENIFTVRTMFWWGHYFSVTLHLAGLYKNKAADKLINAYAMMQEKGYFGSVNEGQWEHHFEGTNYVRLSEMSRSDFERLIRERSFVKLANKVSLQQWDEAAEILPVYFREFIDLLADRPPSR
jgi:hypothetical protein